MEAKAPTLAPALDALAWRRLIGHWPTGVAVLTSTGRTGPRGCTANSVTSLSLEPLLLLVCFDYASNTYAAVGENGCFAVNILADDQEALSRHFATKCDDDEKFHDVPFELVDGVPVLDGTVAWVVCEVEHELPGGDHAIVLGRPVRGAADDRRSPLVFYRSGYRTL